MASQNNEMVKKKLFAKLQDYQVNSQGNAFENSHRLYQLQIFI